MIKVSTRFSFLLPVLLVLIAGCATKPSVIARKNPAYSPTLTSRISIPKRDLRTADLDELGRALNAEFVRRGVTLVPSGKSEYALSFWIEDNWKGAPPDGRQRLLGSPGNRLVVTDTYYRTTTGSYPTISGGRDVYSKGIRLRLFVSQPNGTNRLETAWEGSVDGGPRMSAEHYRALLHVLLDYFGKDFAGKVKLAE